MKFLYFKDYQIGLTHDTPGRTIPETDIVLHAGRIGDF